MVVSASHLPNSSVRQITIASKCTSMIYTTIKYCNKPFTIHTSKFRLTI
jgi:hypothetical protein